MGWVWGGDPIPCPCPVIPSHNPIFTPGIFSGIDTQNEAAWTKLAWFDEGSSHQITSKRGLWHISQNLTKFDQGWPSLTGVDQVWPRFDQAVSDPTGVHYTQKKKPQNAVRDTFPRVRRALTKFDQVWPRFDRTVDQTKNWIGLTAHWPLYRAWWELRFDTL